MGELEMLSLLYMVFCFCLKNERNIWHFSVVKYEKVLSCGLRSEVIVEKRAFRLL